MIRHARKLHDDHVCKPLSILTRPNVFYAGPAFRTHGLCKVSIYRAVDRNKYFFRIQAWPRHCEGIVACRFLLQRGVRLSAFLQSTTVFIYFHLFFFRPVVKANLRTGALNPRYISDWFDIASLEATFGSSIDARDLEPESC